jgi:hypothetical protein
VSFPHRRNVSPANVSSRIRNEGSSLAYLFSVAVSNVSLGPKLRLKIRRAKVVSMIRAFSFCFFCTKVEPVTSR